jgi:hypothetical protein
MIINQLKINMDDGIFTGNMKKQINVCENFEVEFWSNKFRVSPESLKSIVKLVGNSVAAVEAYITEKVNGRI